MKFVTYQGPTGAAVGALDGADRVWDLRAVWTYWAVTAQHDAWASQKALFQVPPDMVSFAEIWHGRGRALASMVAMVKEDERSQHTHGSPLSYRLRDVRLLAPVLRPSKILCIGSSYKEHILKYYARKGVPADQVEFNKNPKLSFFKAPSAIIGPGAQLRYPKGSKEWDCESELGIIIGRYCSQVTPKEALDYVFGYTIANDACIRDITPLQGGYDSPRGKATDTLAPIGPAIVTPDELSHSPNEFKVKLWIDQTLRQNSSTADLIWPIEDIVSEVSQYVTLWPGDVVFTGGPPGTGLEDGRYLREGEVVRIEIDELGILENPVGPPRG